jgi:type IV pilus assembly protein PilM
MVRWQKATVGLDIGSSVIKAVQLRRSGKGIELEKFGIAEIYPGGDKKAAAESVRELRIAAVRKALQSANISAKQAITAVSGESIIVRYIQLPNMPEDELKNALKWEAEEYIPFHIDEVNIDSVILGKADDGGKVDVLLVSAKKELVNEHVDLVRAVGLTPLIIDVDSFAFLNCFEVNYQPNPTDVIALINIGAEITSINIYIGGISRFSRDISIAGDTITTSIQSRLGTSFVEAEEIKISEGAPVASEEAEGEGPSETGLLDTIRGTVEKITGEEMEEDSKEAIAAKVVKNSLTNLVSEIRRSIQFFENQANGRVVQSIVLGGGTSKLRNIDKFFANELNLPVEIIDPLRRISVVGKDIDSDALIKAKQMLGVGIGLALRKVVE